MRQVWAGMVSFLKVAAILAVVQLYYRMVVYNDHYDYFIWKGICHRKF